MSPSQTADLSEPLEDYLETIHHLQAQSRVARAKDIADQMKVSRATVTSALKALAGRGLINYKPYSYITLTESGAEVAREIIRRHQTLTGFFIAILGMDQDHAEATACRVEHAMDAEAVDKLAALVSHINECPLTGPDWLSKVEDGCGPKITPQKCGKCAEASLAALR